MRIDGFLHLEAHGRPEPSTHEFALERLEQVLRVVLLHLHVLVSGHAEGVVLQHLHPGEQLLEVGGDDVLERHETRGPTCRNRGSSGGTFTLAKSSVPVSGLRTTTARLSDSPEM